MITSRAISSCQIGQADGLYCAFPAILQKHPRTLRNNQTAARPPLSGNFAKKAPTFLKINPKSNSPGSRKFAKKKLKFVKSTRRPDPLLEFFRKTL